MKTEETNTGRIDTVSEYIKCDCFTHLLSIECETEYYSKNIEPKDETFVRQSFNFAMFSYGDVLPKPSLKRRIKFCWKYLRTGKMYSDEMIFSPTNAKALADFIDNNLLLPKENNSSL